MGHSSINVTVDIYGHMLKGASRDAIDRLEVALGSKLVAEEEAVDYEVPQVIGLTGGSGWIRTNDQGIMSPLL